MFQLVNIHKYFYFNICMHVRRERERCVCVDCQKIHFKSLATLSYGLASDLMRFEKADSSVHPSPATRKPNALLVFQSRSKLAGDSSGHF